MADGNERVIKLSYSFKVVNAKNYATSAIKKELALNRIQKYLIKNAIDIQDGLLEFIRPTGSRGSYR